MKFNIKEAFNARRLVNFKQMYSYLYEINLFIKF